MVRGFGEIISHTRGLAQKRRVVVAAAADEHALEAVRRATQEGLVTPVLVGEAKKIIPLLERLDFPVPQQDIHDISGDPEAAAKAVSLIREGKADFLMKGSLQTADFMRAVVNSETGLRTDSVISHLALYEIPGYGRLLGVTDGGMILYPTLEQKQWIIRNAVEVYHRLGYDRPNVAVLAAIEVVNPKMQESVDAAELKAMNANGTIAGCLVEGPISYDLAMSLEAAEIKGYESPVTAHADILVMPTMSAGNILGKSYVYTAGAAMAGIIIGARVPIVLTSRSSSADEKYFSLAVSAAISQ